MSFSRQAVNRRPMIKYKPAVYCGTQPVQWHLHNSQTVAIMLPKAAT